MAERRVFQFGERVEGYAIPVLNEREIRAGAGLLFLLMFIAILKVILTGDFVLLKYAATFFLADISVRVLVNPRFAPSLVLGRLIVRNQVPEYVGAPQKRFAWIIGCKLYPLFNKGVVQHCPGEVCTPSERQEIQRVSGGQLLVVLGFAALAVLAVGVLDAGYRQPPRPLFAPEQAARAR